MTPRSRSLAWDATTAIEALAAAETALWVWTPATDELRFTGATRSLGLGPLAPECTAAGFVALAMPQDRSLAERMLKPQDEGAEIAVRLRMRGSETCLWRGVWLEDGLRAAGVVARRRGGGARVDDHPNLEHPLAPGPHRRQCGDQGGA